MAKLQGQRLHSPLIPPHSALPLQPPRAFSYTFQLALPCLEVCPGCTLEEANFGPGASWVSLNPNCSADSMAAQWRVVRVSSTSPYVQLQNIQTSNCLQVNDTASLVAHTGGRAGGMGAVLLAAASAATPAPILSWLHLPPFAMCPSKSCSSSSLPLSLRPPLPHPPPFSGDIKKSFRVLTVPCSGSRALDPADDPGIFESGTPSCSAARGSVPRTRPKRAALPACLALPHLAAPCPPSLQCKTGTTPPTSSS